MVWRGGAPDDAGEGKRECAYLSLEGLILEEEEEEEEEQKEEREEDDEDCAICLGPMGEEEEDQDDVIHRLECSHDFHRSCVESWTTTCTRKGLPLTCPTCRRPLVLG